MTRKRDWMGSMGGGAGVCPGTGGAGLQLLAHEANVRTGGRPALLEGLQAGALGGLGKT